MKNKILSFLISVSSFLNIKLPRWLRLILGLFLCIVPILIYQFYIGDLSQGSFYVGVFYGFGLSLLICLLE